MFLAAIWARPVGSWGAWLGYLLAASCPAMVEKLILVGNPPFQERYVNEITATRLNRLSEEEKSELKTLNELLKKPMTKDKNAFFESMGKIIDKAESLNPVQVQPNAIDARFDIYQKVWPQADELWRSGIFPSPILRFSVSGNTGLV